ncbi:MAG: hypothetical protein OXF85_01855 [Candidatus Saccharibacteria bacterium]|nr:hypothetical protein [Candidatus Saccharibacteria bacterium]MCY4011039.1 hypothetical protein [Candidatus Saccharibacteria bacterium]MCY4088825.1 hypothetical protein [Candidatus Saccharibacteria bacterium]
MFAPLFSVLRANIEINNSDIPAIPKPADQTILEGTLNLVFIVLGSISLLILVIQGMKYALSLGNSEQVNRARNGIIYSLVGLTVATTAWSLVTFTLDSVTGPETVNGQTSSIVNLLANISGYLIFITAIISIIVVIIGGFQLVFSEGNSEQAKKARSTIIYAVIGLLIAIIAGPVLKFFFGFFE